MYVDLISPGDLMFVRCANPVGVALVRFETVDPSARYRGTLLSSDTFLNGQQAIVDPANVLDVLTGVAAEEMACP